MGLGLQGGDLDLQTSVLPFRCSEVWEHRHSAVDPQVLCFGCKAGAFQSPHKALQYEQELVGEGPGQNGNSVLLGWHQQPGA